MDELLNLKFYVKNDKQTITQIQYMFSKKPPFLYDARKLENGTIKTTINYSTYSYYSN